MQAVCHVCTACPIQLLAVTSHTRIESILLDQIRSGQISCISSFCSNLLTGWLAALDARNTSQDGSEHHFFS